MTFSHLIMLFFYNICSVNTTSNSQYVLLCACVLLSSSIYVLAVIMLCNNQINILCYFICFALSIISLSFHLLLYPCTCKWIIYCWLWWNPCKIVCLITFVNQGAKLIIVCKANITTMDFFLKLDMPWYGPSWSF